MKLWSVAIALGIVWLLNLTAVPLIDPYVLSIIAYAGINVLLAVSLNLVNGFTGQFSMGHAGFMAVGAYASTTVTLWGMSLMPELSLAWQEALFPISVVVGMAVAALAGLLVGLPTLRLKGDYLAIVTLGFGEIIRVVILNVDALGGARGLPGIPKLTTFGVLYSAVVLTVFFCWRLVRSEYGRSMLAVREDEIAAESTGVDTTRTKVQTFSIAAGIAGGAGALFAHFLQYLNPAIFDFNRSFEVIIMVVLGGMGSLSGSILAAILLTVMREALRPLQSLTGVDLRMIIYSAILIGFMLTRPRGLFGTEEWTDILARKRKPRKARA